MSVPSNRDSGTNGATPNEVDERASRKAHFGEADYNYDGPEQRERYAEWFVFEKIHAACLRVTGVSCSLSLKSSLANTR